MSYHSAYEIFLTKFSRHLFVFKVGTPLDLFEGVLYVGLHLKLHLFFRLYQHFPYSRKFTPSRPFYNLSSIHSLLYGSNLLTPSKRHLPRKQRVCPQSFVTILSSTVRLAPPRLYRMVLYAWNRNPFRLSSSVQPVSLVHYIKLIMFLVTPSLCPT